MSHRTPRSFDAETAAKCGTHSLSFMNSRRRSRLSRRAPRGKLAQGSMNVKPEANGGAVAALAAKVGRSWSAIHACAADSETQRKRIMDALHSEKLVQSDCSFIVSGSLARNEFTPGPDAKDDKKTEGSDVDWTLLVDGQADPQHLPTVQNIANVLAELGFKRPGPTALFGGLVFSHELVHVIGGDADTNKNLTRRLLLLLESRMLAETSNVRERVMRNIFRRYLDEDRGYHAVHELKIKVPRFLLNDISRFWRTMAVDYAAKRRERAWSGWAIRNVKLRLSRKLIFVAGLAMCLSCQLCPPESVKKDGLSEADFYAALNDFMREFTNRTPLDVLAGFCLRFDEKGDASRLIFDHYDRFLMILRDHDKRGRLEVMDLEQAIDSEVFKEARAVGDGFQAGLDKLFFDNEKHPELTTATQRYGVF